MDSMFSGSISGSIRISNRQTVDLRAGDAVTVHVIKRLIGNKWAVGIKGRTFPALSDVELLPGSTIKASVSRAGSKFVLHINEIISNSAEGTLKSRGEMSPALRFIHSALLQAALQRSLSKSTTAIPMGTAKQINRLFKRLTRKKSKSEMRIARSISAVVEKGLDPTSTGLEAVLSVLSLIGQEGERGGRHRRRQGYYNSEDRASAGLRRMVKNRINGKENNPERYHPLQLFNHLAISDETWIISPYRFFTGESTYHGLIKILLDTKRHRVKRLVLDVKTGESIVSFLLQQSRKKMRMSVYCSESGLNALMTKKIRGLVSILQNHGVECDDSIYEEEEFDGFSAPWERETYNGVSIVT